MSRIEEIKWRHQGARYGLADPQVYADIAWLLDEVDRLTGMVVDLLAQRADLTRRCANLLAVAEVHQKCAARLGAS